MRTGKISNKVISLCGALAFALTALAMPASAEESEIGAGGAPIAVTAAAVGASTPTPTPGTSGTDSNQLPAPGNLRWDGETGTAVWEAVPNAGTLSNGWTMYYECHLYYSENPASNASECQPRGYRGVYEDPTPRFDFGAKEMFDTDGYYYFTVKAMGDGVNYTDSPESSLSAAFHYTKPSAQLPTPKNLTWQKHGAKYYGVWDNIFGDEYINAKGFNVECYNENEQMEYTHFFSRAELIADRESKGNPGTMLYMDYPNGKYRYKVQAISANLNQYSSSEWSELSPWAEVYEDPMVEDRDDSDDDSSDSGGSGSAAASSRAPAVQTSNTFSSLAASAKSKGETVARSRGTGEVTVKGSAWSQLEGLTFQHDTVSNGMVQVRVKIANPASLTQDTKVSAYVSGKEVTRVQSLFDKHFDNETRVMHFDQTGAWGQAVRVAAYFDLTGMDKENLVFYSYDKTANAYRQIENPNYTIDANGYTHFTTSFAGDIIVSDGPLSKK